MKVYEAFVYLITFEKPLFYLKFWTISQTLSLRKFSRNIFVNICIPTYRYNGSVAPHPCHDRVTAEHTMLQSDNTPVQHFDFIISRFQVL